MKKYKITEFILGKVYKYIEDQVILEFFTDKTSFLRQMNNKRFKKLKLKQDDDFKWITYSYKNKTRFKIIRYKPSKKEIEEFNQLASDLKKYVIKEVLTAYENPTKSKEIG